MSLTSHQNVGFDSRLMEIEELYRQRKPDIAKERLKSLEESSFSPVGFEEGFYKLLLARERNNSGRYQESIKLCQEANSRLSTSAFHRRVGLIQWLLYKNYSALGDLKTSEEYARDAYAFFRRIDDREGMIDALNGLGKLAFIRCDFEKAIEHVNNSIELSKGDNIRMARLIGNLGRIEILNGDWKSAEHNLKTALKLAGELKLDDSIARNHLSLGFLYLRQRHFSLAARELKSAEVIIEKIDLPREKLILLEYEGELAFEMGDIVGARKKLEKGYETAKKLAMDSAAVSQLSRRLAQVEQALDINEQALKTAQKALDLSMRLGEKSEIGMSQIVIAEIFASRENFDMAIEYSQNGLETLRRAGDPYDLARALVSAAEIFTKYGEMGRSAINKLYDEAFRLFNNLKLFYWSGEVRLRQGVFSCEHADISRGFRNLYEAEKIFEKISERGRIRSIQHFLQDLAKKAIEKSLGPDNEYIIFGNYLGEGEYGSFKSGDLKDILDMIRRRTRCQRAIVYSFHQDETEVIGDVNYSQHQKKRFIQQFEELLGEEFNREQPTLLMDTRRDPFINELVPLEKGLVTSTVIVTPLRLSGEITGYLYLDRVSSNGRISPFSQPDLNFVVGFADLIAFKLAEHDRQTLEEDNKRLKAQLLESSIFPNIITQNKQMLEMLSRVQQVVDADISISIEGETGSGKDLLAKTIHYSSNRRNKRFISVNCAALPETLLESELFGHKKGAFTGADRDKNGLFVEADGGTFFLDEIADMPQSIQAKVLRVLEEKEIVRLGDTKPQKVDVRIISATNKDLRAEMEAGRFRQDLYYRLTALTFRIPPLRDRKEDIPLLIRNFAGDRARFTPDAVRMLVGFDWPGNVRELENEIKKLILLAGERGIIEPSLLSSKITSSGQEEAERELNIDTDVDFNDRFSLYDFLAEYEKRFIIKALRDQGGIKKHAAASLNIPESTLRLKIKQYNIDTNNLNNIN